MKCSLHHFPPHKSTQDDVVLGSLSVRENLQFSAALRLAGHMTASDRKQRVERVIETLNLFSCADTKVQLHKIKDKS